DLLLEAHVALDRVHEVRDEVVAALELDLDLGQRLVDAIPLLDQAVVQPDHEDHDQDDDRDDDDQRPVHANLRRRRHAAPRDSSLAGGTDRPPETRRFEACRRPPAVNPATVSIHAPPATRLRFETPNRAEGRNNPMELAMAALNAPTSDSAGSDGPAAIPGRPRAFGPPARGALATPPP